MSKKAKQDLLGLVDGYDLVIRKAAKNVRWFRLYRQESKEDKDRHIVLYSDRALHTMLDYIDLLIGLKYLVTSQSIGNHLEANYFARIVALNCYEILHNSHKILGKDARSEATKNTKLLSSLLEFDKCL